MARPTASLRFTLDDRSCVPFGPRVGTLVLSRPSGCSITLRTPTLLTPTSRGVVPHLTRSHVRCSPAIGLVHVALETFLEQTPPVPTVHPGPNALHRFLGFDVDKHIVVLGLRDPSDRRAMPPNGNGHVNAQTLRGVRKVAPGDWTAYTNGCTPDLVVALSDTPHTASQKRLTKSIDRSLTWLRALLSSSSSPVLVHLSGSASHAARAAFSASLTADDAGVSGYTVDLAHLRSSSPSSLLHTSLSPLPHTKPRFATGLEGPHDVLRLVRDVGLDVVDAQWAFDAASVGLALDFAFPVLAPLPTKREIGHNLYSPSYKLDFTPLSSSPCPCIACAPCPPTLCLTHDSLPPPPLPPPSTRPGLTRAYIHHLLTTHEMSAHALLAAHNLAVFSSFLAGVRCVISSSSSLSEEIEKFDGVYFEEEQGGTVIRDAKAMWASVDRARGKGRLRREKEGE